MAGKTNESNEGEAAGSIVKESLVSLMNLSTEELQNKASHILAALEAGTQQQIHQEKRRVILESMLMQAYTIKAFRAHIMNPNKVTSREKVLAFVLEQVNIAGTLYPDYINFVSPKAGTSAKNTLDYCLSEVLSKCTTKEVLPNGIHQLKFTQSNIFTECTSLAHQLTVIHRGAKASLKIKDIALYTVFSKYAVQLENLVGTLQFFSSRYVLEANLIPAPEPPDFKTKLAHQISEFSEQIFHRPKETKTVPEIKGMAARELTSELKLSQSASREAQKTAVELLEELQNRQATDMERRQVYRHLGQIKTQTDGVKRTLADVLPVKTQAMPRVTNEINARPQARLTTERNRLFTAATGPSRLEQLDTIFADEAQQNKEAGIF